MFNKLFALCICFYAFTFNINAQNNLLLGGGIKINLPTNTFGSDEFGFNDVANVGGGISFNTLWFFNPRLSIESELGYSYFPKDKKTWNQQRRGDIKVNYQMLNLTAQGNIYFNESEIRPYIGVAFGFYYLRNLVDFASYNTDTSYDESVKYISKTLHLGFGPETGILIEINRFQYATISFGYTIIPNIKSENRNIGGNPVTINPHGKQNHWKLTAKLFFGKK